MAFHGITMCLATQPLVLNQDEVQHVEFSLGYTACRLEEGDQLRLHVCSAAHPRWLRHPLQPQGEDWLLGDSEVWRSNMGQRILSYNYIEILVWQEYHRCLRCMI